MMLSLSSCQQEVSWLEPQIIQTYPHDPAAFTQGLVFDDGKLYESTGLNRYSSLREVELATGEVKRFFPLEDTYFAEGLALVGNKLYQITWLNSTVFIYNRDNFSREASLSYHGEGWGLCYDGVSLYMSDGSSLIRQRNPADFTILKTLSVNLDGQAVDQLNELECVGNYIYANIWHSDTILKIDKNNGKVISQIDASKLLSPEERAQLDTEAVLNGIAYNPSSNTFYLTGKWWPKLFEVRFVTKPHQ
ncbi:MAG: glutaminyl-peptide cyclotransferase [Deinococcales bacterium]